MSGILSDPGARWVEIGGKRVWTKADVNGWQPIETAPKDEARVLLTDGSLISIGMFERGYAYSGWTNEAEPQPTDGPGAVAGYWQDSPTHWMPLPEPPK